MVKLMEIKSDSPFLKILAFKPFVYQGTERRAQQFSPDGDEPKEKEVETPWGGTLTAEPGDYIVSDLQNPDDSWVVKKDVFENTYSQTRKQTFIKSAGVYLVPLTEITGDPDEKVIIHTLEGLVTVRSGDFYLAQGAKKEIWPIPKEKVGTELIPLE